MRVWDLPVWRLCDKHLVAQHHEIHVVYSVISNRKSGWRHHPEVKRWVGRLPALAHIHYLTVVEMNKRRFNHFTDLPRPWGGLKPPEPWEPVVQQILNLRRKGCDCDV